MTQTEVYGTFPQARAYGTRTQTKVHATNSHPFDKIRQSRITQGDKKMAQTEVHVNN